MPDLRRATAEQAPGWQLGPFERDHQLGRRAQAVVLAHAKAAAELAFSITMAATSPPSRRTL
jgi:hypothetical protein